MELTVITSKGCGHCRAYINAIRAAAPHIDIKTVWLDEMKSRRPEQVPHTYLYDEGTLIREWAGATLRPIFDLEDHMKIRFKRDARDKYTGQKYKKGSVKDFPEARAQEIIATGIATEVKPKNDNDHDSKE